MSIKVGPERMKAMADRIAERIPGIGFCLITFDFGEGNGKYSNYISNAQREDMIVALEETIHRLRTKQDFDTPHLN